MRTTPLTCQYNYNTPANIHLTTSFDVGELLYNECGEEISIIFSVEINYRVITMVRNDWWTHSRGRWKGNVTVTNFVNTEFMFGFLSAISSVAAGTAATAVHHFEEQARIKESRVQTLKHTIRQRTAPSAKNGRLIFIICHTVLFLGRMIPHIVFPLSFERSALFFYFNIL